MYICIPVKKLIPIFAIRIYATRQKLIEIRVRGMKAQLDNNNKKSCANVIVI